MEALWGCPYWILDGRLGGCWLPESLEDLRRLRAMGVDYLVSLATDGELARHWGSPEAFLEVAASEGLKVIRFPVPDGGAPDPDEACRLFRKVSVLESEGHVIVFHCVGGRGRTGTMLAAYLAATRGLDPLEALEAVRKANPFAGPVSEAQFMFLEYFPVLCRIGVKGGNVTG